MDVRNSLIEVDKLLVDLTVITMNSQGTVYENGAIAISKSQIVDCGPTEEIKKKYKANEVLKGSHLVALPGMINAHTHLPMSLFRGVADDLPLMEWLQKYIFPIESKFVTAPFVQLGAELAALELIRGGVTCVADMYYFEDVIADTAANAGLRGVFGQAMADFASPDSQNWQANVKRVKEHLERFKDHERVIPALAPHAPYTVSKPHLEEVAALSNQYSAPILIHVAEDISESHKIMKEHGCSPVKYLYDLGILNPRTIAAHMVWPTEEDFLILQKSGVGVAHCPESNLKLNSGIAPVEKMLHQKIPVSIATDGAASNNDLDLVAEMSLAAKLHKVANKNPLALKASTALSLVTSEAARVVKLHNKIGQIGAGFSADITIFDFDKPHLTPVYDPVSHLVYAGKASDVEHVMVGGKWLLKEREYKTLDKERILFEARKLSEKIRLSVLN